MTNGTGAEVTGLRQAMGGGDVRLSRRLSPARLVSTLSRIVQAPIVGVEGGRPGTTWGQISNILEGFVLFLKFVWISFPVFYYYLIPCFNYCRSCSLYMHTIYIYAFSVQSCSDSRLVIGQNVRQISNISRFVRIHIHKAYRFQMERAGR